MNKDEIKTVFRAIVAIYPNSYKDIYRIKDAISVWAVIFASAEARLVESALYTYISEEHAFAPTPGHIQRIMNKITNPNELSEAQAWSMVRRALSNGLYGAQEEFDRLPEDVQKAVGSAQWIHSVAMDEDANMSVESSNFFRRYREVVRDRRERECMPPAVRKIVDELVTRRSFDEVAQLEDRRLASELDYERRRQEAVKRFLNPEIQIGETDSGRVAAHAG